MNKILLSILIILTIFSKQTSSNSDLIRRFNEKRKLLSNVVSPPSNDVFPTPTIIFEKNQGANWYRANPNTNQRVFPKYFENDVA